MLEQLGKVQISCLIIHLAEAIHPQLMMHWVEDILQPWLQMQQPTPMDILYKELITMELAIKEFNRDEFILNF